MANMRTKIGGTKTETAFWACGSFSRGKLMPTDLVIGSSETKCWHLDICCKLCQRHTFIVVLLICIFKHPDVKVLVQDVQAGPIVPQMVLIVQIVVFANILFQLWQLLSPDSLTQIHANSP